MLQPGKPRNFTDVQRDTKSDVADLQKRVALIEIKDKARAIDAVNQPLLLAHMANRKQVVYRASGAFQKAISSFQSMQTKQAQTNAIMLQWEMLAVSLVAATAFEPIFDRTLGKWSTWLGEHKEQIENPFNVLVQGISSNVGPAYAAKTASDKGQPPSANASDQVDAADPITFLTKQLAAIEGKTVEINNSFSLRATKFEDPKADWEHFDLAAHSKEYTDALATGETLFGSNEKLKSDDEMATIIERHLWANWVKFIALNFQWTGGTFGATINGRLNALGIPALAGAAKLDDSYVIYCSTSRSEFKKIGAWASTYTEKISQSAT